MGIRAAILLEVALTAAVALLQMHAITAAKCSASMPCTLSSQCCSARGNCGTGTYYCGTGCLGGPCDSYNYKANLENTQNNTTELAYLVTPEVFNNIFPARNDFYTYEAFLTAASAFPAFGTTGSSIARRRDIAAFFAHVSQETAGLSIREGEGHESAEAFCCEGSCVMEGTNPPKESFACVPGKKYFARGPMQLTWNYNYGSASKALGADLLADPELLSKDAVLSFKSALWMWMSGSDKKPSAHSVMSGPWTPTASDVAAARLPGFGATINILKGTEECGHDSDLAEARIHAYLDLARLLHVPAGSHLDCATMLPF